MQVVLVADHTYHLSFPIATCVSSTLHVPRTAWWACTSATSNAATIRVTRNFEVFLQLQLQLTSAPVHTYPTGALYCMGSVHPDNLKNSTDAWYKPA